MQDKELEQKIPTPQEVLQIMLARDAFTEFLGLQVDEISLGYCRLHYTARPDMCNGFLNMHGGALFSASDSALAFAGNSHGRIAVALDVSINFMRPAKAGERLIVEAKELYLGYKTGVYEITTTNEAGELVATFKGTTYRTSKIVS